jgi:site-specific DNA-cytosine methylase
MEYEKMTDKSNCLMAQNDTNFMKYEGPRIIDLFGKKVRVLGIRRLTPTECARLQTIPTWYKWECSDSQAYRMLGNGWTVEVIKHFFQFLPFEREA